MDGERSDDHKKILRELARNLPRPNMIRANEQDRTAADILATIEAHGADIRESANQMRLEAHQLMEMTGRINAHELPLRTLETSSDSVLSVVSDYYKFAEPPTPDPNPAMCCDCHCHI